MRVIVFSLFPLVCLLYNHSQRYIGLSTIGWNPLAVTGSPSATHSGRRLTSGCKHVPPISSSCLVTCPCLSLFLELSSLPSVWPSASKSRCKSQLNVCCNSFPVWQILLSDEAHWYYGSSSNATSRRYRIRHERLKS